MKDVALTGRSSSMKGTSRNTATGTNRKMSAAVRVSCLRSRLDQKDSSGVKAASGLAHALHAIYHLGSSSMVVVCLPFVLTVQDGSGDNAGRRMGLSAPGECLAGRCLADEAARDPDVRPQQLDPRLQVCRSKGLQYSAACSRGHAVPARSTGDTASAGHALQCQSASL